MLALVTGRPERACWTILPKRHPRLTVMGRFSNKTSVHLDFPPCCISVQNYRHVPLMLVLFVAWIHSKAQIKGFLAILSAARNGVPVFKPRAWFLVSLYLLQLRKLKRDNEKWLLDVNVYVHQGQWWTDSILYPLQSRIWLPQVKNGVKVIWGEGKE